MKSQTNRIIKRLQELGSISDNSTCLTRSYGTKAHQESAALLMLWMKEAGLDVSIDNIGNIRGKISCKSNEAKHFVVGSHFDTVFDAGKYDGPLGILLNIEMAQYIKDTNQQLPFHFNCIAFADEEGSRFNTAYLGSSVIAGNFDTEWLTRQDDDGVSLTQVINEIGGNTDKIKNDKIQQKDWLGYFEAHIEQGPVLCKEDVPVCLVTGISAQARVIITWEGMAGHAGTSPMDLRKDALCAAAELILKIEEIANENKEQLVATVGKLLVTPNTSNVVPGLVKHNLDIRSPDGLFLEDMMQQIKQIGAQISTKRSIIFDWKLMQANAAINCDQELQSMLERSIKKGNIQRTLKLPSGAGHDAVMISKVAPVSMLFVRCTDGISHNPLENVEPDDIESALSVCTHFIDELINSHLS